MCQYFGVTVANIWLCAITPIQATMVINYRIS